MHSQKTYQDIKIMSNLNHLLASLAERKHLMIRTEASLYHHDPSLGNLLIDTWKHNDPKNINWDNLKNTCFLLEKLYKLDQMQIANIIYETATIVLRYENRVEQLLAEGR